MFYYCTKQLTRAKKYDETSGTVCGFILEFFNSFKDTSRFGRAVLHRGNVRASHPTAPDSILGIPLNFSEEKIFIDVAEINQRHFLECGKA